MSNNPFEYEKIKFLREKANNRLNLNEKELDYFVFSDSISNNVYSVTDDKITILFKSGETTDIAEASDMLNISVLSKVVKKYFLCYSKQDAK